MKILEKNLLNWKMKEERGWRECWTIERKNENGRDLISLKASHLYTLKYHKTFKNLLFHPSISHTLPFISLNYQFHQFSSYSHSISITITSYENINFHLIYKFTNLSLKIVEFLSSYNCTKITVVTMYPTYKNFVLEIYSLLCWSNEGIKLAYLLLLPMWLSRMNDSFIVH